MSMVFSRGFALYYVATIAALIEVQVSAFFTQSTLSHVSRDARVGAIASRTTNQLLPHLRHQRSVGPARMADSDGMDAAREAADKLRQQAAALREEASSAEAAMGRDPAAAAKVPDEPAPAQSEDMMPRSEISDSMKARLRRELESQGANPNKSAGNPILVVAAVVGLLVIVGGKGIFY